MFSKYVWPQPPIALSPEAVEHIKLHACRDYPNEACGIITSDGYYHPMANLADKPQTHFKFDEAEYKLNLGHILAVVHTHTKYRGIDIRTPSHTDVDNQKKTAVPWLIYGCDGENITKPTVYPRVRVNGYLNRPFIWYINDCYTLLQDYYHFELGIDLADYKLDGDYQDIRHLNHIFEKHIADYGFYEIDLKAIENGDVLLLDWDGLQGNHLGIYNDGHVMHQGALSVNPSYDIFIGRIRKILRHERRVFG